jgi:hypothetical protein
VGINDKAFRLRAARDLLHLKGRHEPTFKKKIELIVEILGMIHSPRNLSYCRREATKLRAATMDPTREQLLLFGVLDDRLFKKAELIRARQERKKAAKKAKAGMKRLGAQSIQSEPAPAMVPAPPVCVEPGFRSILDEFRDEGSDV